jgi:hypothetical protein
MGPRAGADRMGAHGASRGRRDGAREQGPTGWGRKARAGVGGMGAQGASGGRRDGARKAPDERIVGPPAFSGCLAAAHSR